MAARLQIPALILAIVSICLNIAIIGCAGRTLHVFNEQALTNVYFLPMWPQHFDTRELSVLIGTSVVILILNLVLIAGQFVRALPSPILSIATTVLSIPLSLTALIFTSVLNHHAPTRDTLQTYTCRWQGLSDEAYPHQFGTLCHQTRFAFYTTIPSFIIQLLLLGLAVSAHKAQPSSPRGLRLMNNEKDHELGHVMRQESFDTKADSQRSVQTSRIVAGKR